MTEDSSIERPEGEPSRDGVPEPRRDQSRPPLSSSYDRAPRQGGRSAPSRGGAERRGGSRPGDDRRGGGQRSGGPDRRRDDRSGSGSRPQGRDGRDTGRDGKPARAGERDDRGGSRLAPKSPRLPEPRIPEEVTGKELDRAVHQQLRTLSKENAEGVAQHLVMVAATLEADNLEAALAHAETAVRRAGRVPAAREALGMVAYRLGDFARALTEFRTVRRLSGSSHLLPLMVDCERGLGRHSRALELAATPEARTLTQDERQELAIVVSGIRRDLGQDDAALIALQIPALRQAAGPSVCRLHYAYADVLLGLGREEEAREWFLKAVEGDTDAVTDAVERLEELDGIVVELGEDDEEDGAEVSQAVVSEATAVPAEDV